MSLCTNVQVTVQHTAVQSSEDCVRCKLKMQQKVHVFLKKLPQKNCCFTSALTSIINDFTLMRFHLFRIKTQGQLEETFVISQSANVH